MRAKNVWWGDSFDMPSIVEFAVLFIVALSFAFIGWAVVRLTSHGEK